MERFYLITNRAKDPDLTVTDQIRQYLEERGKTCLLCDNSEKGEKYHYTDEEMTKALYVAAGIGGVIASRAFIAGAQGGCQAEIGSASAMAAGGAVHLRGGSVEAVAHAAAMALKNLLGLVCDPVAGLVEVPCVKRNVSGAVVALSAADMALAGVRSRIPPDEVIDAMREVGISMPACLRETGEGGLAATPEGIKMRDRIMD